MRIVFMGTPDFAVPCLRKLVENQYDVVAVVTQPDRPRGRKRQLTAPPVKEAAISLGIPVYQPEKLRENGVDDILELQPDLIVTVAYGQLLPKEIIHYPKYGCINVHASLLPKYRGGAPIHKSIIDGEKETGVTIMYMVEKLDAGDMLSQVRVPIEEEDHVGTMHNKLSAAGSQLLLETIPCLVAGEITPVAQDESQVSFAWNIKREDEALHWNKTARQLFNQIRGLCPWPVAYTHFQGQVMKVWKSKVLEETSSNQEEAGTILAVSAQGIDVQTGQGILRLLEVQPAGKKAMNVSDYLRGNVQVQPGMVFESELPK